MTLLWLLALLILGGGLSWAGENLRRGCGHWIALTVLAIAILLLGRYLPQALDVLAAEPKPQTLWWDHIRVPWIPRFGISFTLAIDGLGFLMLALTLLCGLFGLVMTWREIRRRTGCYLANYLWTLAGVVGVFCAQDLFLFFCFWETMLVPMLLLIAIWGHEQRTRAAIQFFIFTQASSLLLLAAIVGSTLVHYQMSGSVSFSPQQLTATLHTQFAETPYAYWLMLGFFIAFAVKLPAILVHTWLPDAHTQAPTAGSVLLAAILLKTGAYGLIRFTLPLFPAASTAFSPVAMALGVAGILYGALMAFSQTDIKRLIAYSSVSHMGFVLLGIYALNSIALQGAVAQMVAHGLSTAALFGIAGSLQHRLHSRDINDVRGIWQTMPALAAVFLFFIVAAMGLPGLANFVGESLVLIGTYARFPWFSALAAVGLIGAAIYGLKLVVRVLFGPPPAVREASDATMGSSGLMDLRRRELFALLLPLLLLVWIGLYPQPLLRQSAGWSNLLATYFTAPAADGDKAASLQGAAP
ncbi:complex I subunit 4 family protein [Microbulbifer harenosus]|uniref:NADH-quinone oxidoreductase subunit M n=1 Tax=Microbulbifer harenosus TaxID=2576840 RepID=A0ABY2UN43_9GAMM|nr:NADH-quinone oxidoreductase subunit M [Microbulbifer harenosus]TLM79672.1 NADH-quinone oxidoreductase subunit M [Microbulbifer harenosus]